LYISQQQFEAERSMNTAVVGIFLAFVLQLHQQQRSNNQSLSLSSSKKLTCHINPSLIAKQCQRPTQIFSGIEITHRGYQ
jgi:hypothetical protein